MQACWFNKCKGSNRYKIRNASAKSFGYSSMPYNNVLEFNEFEKVSVESLEYQ